MFGSGLRVQPIPDADTVFILQIEKVLIEIKISFHLLRLEIQKPPMIDLELVMKDCLNTFGFKIITLQIHIGPNFLLLLVFDSGNFVKVKIFEL